MSAAWLQALQSGNVQEKWQAVRALRAAKNDEARAALVAALGDEEAIVRWEAAVSLARHMDSSVRESLTDALASDDPRCQAAAADAVGQAAHVGEMVPLLRGLLASPSAAVRQAAACALGRARDSSALPDLLSLVKDSSLTAAVRHSAFEAIAQIGPQDIGQETQSMLAEALAGAFADPCPPVRAAAIKAIGRWHFHTLSPLLTQALYDGDIAVRWQAVRAAARVGTLAQVPLLRRLLTVHETAFGKPFAAWAGYAISAIIGRESARRIKAAWLRLCQRVGQLRSTVTTAQAAVEASSEGDNPAGSEGQT